MYGRRQLVLAAGGDWRRIAAAIALASGHMMGAASADTD